MAAKDPTEPPRPSGPQAPASPQQAREARLAAALRANLRRRKAQARARTEETGAPPEIPPDKPSGGRS